MEVKDHLSLAELERLERSETSSQRAKRLRIVILAMGGFTAPAIAMCVGLSRRICQRWVCRYNEEGLAGLNDLRGQQAAPVLTVEQEARMRQRLAAGPLAADRVCSLRGVDVQRILAQEFGILRSLPAVYG
jgi:transposase